MWPAKKKNNMSGHNFFLFQALGLPNVKGLFRKVHSNNCFSLVKEIFAVVK